MWKGGDSLKRNRNKRKEETGHKFFIFYRETTRSRFIQVYFPFIKLSEQLLLTVNLWPPTKEMSTWENHSYPLGSIPDRPHSKFNHFLKIFFFTISFLVFFKKKFSYFILSGLYIRIVQSMNRLSIFGETFVNIHTHLRSTGNLTISTIV